MTSVDVAVVGAGIVGARCALELCEAGLQVALVDPGQPGLGVSSRCMGHLLAIDESPQLLRFTAACVAMWAQLAADLPDAAEYAVHGTLWVAVAEQADRLPAKLAVLRSAGVDCEQLDAASLAECEAWLRPGLAGAIRVTGDGSVYPPVVARHWVERAQATGRLRRVETAALRVEPGRVDLVDGTQCSAGAVVVAAGLGSGALLAAHGFASSLHGRKGHLVITRKTPVAVRHQLLELGYTDSVHARDGISVACNIQPRATGQLLIGSSRELACDTQVDRAVVRRMLDRAAWFVPALAGVPALRAWAGVRPVGHAHRPMIGAVPGLSRVWLAGGHEGLGITCAPLTARWIVDDILGRPARAVDPSDRAYFCPTRPNGPQGTQAAYVHADV